MSEHVGKVAASFATVTASDVATLVRRHARAGSPGRAQLMATASRAMFRFLFHAGELAVDLSVAVPTVPDWRLATLPRSLAPEHVERLLAACDRQTATGRRNHAILLLLAAWGSARARWQCLSSMICSGARARSRFAGRKGCDMSGSRCQPTWPDDLIAFSGRRAAECNGVVASAALGC